MNDAKPAVASLPAKLAGIDRDEAFDRSYIPVAPGWEVQTRGKGSTFRIAEPDDSRLPIPDSPYLHETLERMARAVHAHVKALEAALAKPASGDGLPELPFSPYLVSEWAGPEMTDRNTWTAYTAEQMRAIRDAGIAYGRRLATPEQPGSSVQGEAAEQDLRDFVEEIGTNGKPTGYFLFNAQPEVQGATYGILDPDYARVFTIARCLAWAEGYALAMQGSFTRDLDLLAVPWTEAACEPEHLARRIVDAAGLRITAESRADEKPHGRIVWTLKFQTFGDPRFVDLSIMPRTTPLPAPAAEQGDTITAANPGDDHGRQNCSHNGGDHGGASARTDPEDQPARSGIPEVLGVMDSGDRERIQGLRNTDPLVAQPEARGVEGMVLVPREPTDAMIEAGRYNKGTVDCLFVDDDGQTVHDFVLAYRAMLAAAPAAPGAVDEAMIERAEAYMLRVLPNKSTACLGGRFNFYELLTAALAPDGGEGE